MKKTQTPPGLCPKEINIIWQTTLRAQNLTLSTSLLQSLCHTVQWILKPKRTERDNLRIIFDTCHLMFIWRTAGIRSEMLTLQKRWDLGGNVIFKSCTHICLYDTEDLICTRSKRAHAHIPQATIYVPLGVSSACLDRALLHLHQQCWTEVSVAGFDY